MPIVEGLNLNWGHHAERSQAPGGRRVRDKPQADLSSKETSQPARQLQRRHTREESRGGLQDRRFQVVVATTSTNFSNGVI